MKILFLVLDTFAPEYQVLKQAQLNTWCKDAISVGHRVVFYRGNVNSENLFKDQTLTVKSNDSISNSTHKLVLAIEHCLENMKDYDYIYRTNLSSYIDVKMMEAYLAAHATNLDALVYAGVIGLHYSKPVSLLRMLIFQVPYLRGRSIKFKSTRFASGSGFFLAWRTCDLIIKNRNIINYKLIDDVAIAKLLFSFGILPSSLPRIDTLDDYNKKQDSLIHFPHDSQVFHYRIKGASRIKDSISMHWLHSKSNKLDAMRSLRCFVKM